MKTINKYIVILGSLFILASCQVYPTSSRFTMQPPKMGITIEQFVAQFGVPLKQDKYYDNNNNYFEELMYREYINGNQLQYNYDIRAINSFFLFKNGKLISQHQEDDFEYQKQREREEDREMIRKQIETERKRIETERERIETERMRIKKEREEKEESNNFEPLTKRTKKQSSISTHFNEKSNLLTHLVR